MAADKAFSAGSTSKDGLKSFSSTVDSDLVRILLTRLLALAKLSLSGVLMKAATACTRASKSNGCSGRFALTAEKTSVAKPWS